VRKNCFVSELENSGDNVSRKFRRGRTGVIGALIDALLAMSIPIAGEAATTDAASALTEVATTGQLQEITVTAQKRTEDIKLHGAPVDHRHHRDIAVVELLASDYLRACRRRAASADAQRATAVAEPGAAAVVVVAQLVVEAVAVAAAARIVVGVAAAAAAA
jgi:hypothetical protein